MASNDVKVTIGLDDAQFRAGMDSAARIASDKTRDMQSSFGVLQAFVSSAMAGVSVAAMGAFVKSAIDSADALNDISARTGVAVQQLAGFQVAATLSGTSLETVAKGNKALSASLVKNSELFQQLGIDTKNPQEAMIQLADVFAGMDDQAKKAALAQELFGKAGMDLLPMLADGSAALREQIAVGQQLNPITDDMAARAGAFNDKLDMMRMAGKSVATQVAGNMLPLFDQLAGQFLQTANDSGALKSASDVLTFAIRGLVSGALVAIGIFQDFGSVIGGTAAAAMAALSGNFKEAGGILAQVEADHQARATRLRASLAGIWSDAGGAAPSAGAGQRVRDNRGERLVGALVRPKAADNSAREAERAAEEARRMQAEQISAASKAAQDAIAVQLELSHRKTALGQQTALDELNTARDLAEKRHAIALDEARKLAELQKAKPLEYQKAMDKIAQLQRQHDLDMAKQQTAMEIEKKRISDAAAAAQQKQMDEMFKPLTSAFEKSITGIIQGNQTLGQAMSNLAQSIVLEFANMGVKLIADWLKTELEKTLITQTQAAARGAAEGASGGASGGGIGGLVSKGIGWVGSLFSAAGGFDVPSGVNPVTQLHANEMVLPADIAGPLRSMVNNNNITVNMMMHGGQSAQPVDQVRRAGGLVAQQLAGVMASAGRFG